jgi:predicted RNA methylase
VIAWLKSALPDRPVPMRVWRGPFRGARIVANPRASVRKVLGLYEHELNSWFEATLPSVTRILDVGANDGYFALGCAAAFNRLGISGEIVCFEPAPAQADALRQAANAVSGGPVRIDVVQAIVGQHAGRGVVTLDDLQIAVRRRTLIKIDVEGAEWDVIRGAESWIEPSNAFVIEVHRRPYLDLITRHFTERGVPMRRIDQRPLPMLGRGARDAENWWLVSQVPPGRAA